MWQRERELKDIILCKWVLTPMVVQNCSVQHFKLKNCGKCSSHYYYYNILCNINIAKIFIIIIVILWKMIFWFCGDGARNYKNLSACIFLPMGESWCGYENWGVNFINIKLTLRQKKKKISNTIVKWVLGVNSSRKLSRFINTDTTGFWTNFIRFHLGSS